MRTARRHNPVLPSVLSVNLEGQHGTLLGGSIVGQIMGVLCPVGLACAGGALLGLIGQWVLLSQVPRTGGRDLVLPLIRTALYIAGLGLLIFHWRVIWPRVWKY